MGKRTYKTTVTIIALVYSKLANDVDMISREKRNEFDQIINDNLDKMESTCEVGLRSSCEDDPQLFYSLVRGEDGKVYAVIAPRINFPYLNMENLKKDWIEHVSLYSNDIIIASQQANALEFLGIKDISVVNNKLKDVLKIDEFRSKKENILSSKGKRKIKKRKY